MLTEIGLCEDYDMSYRHIAFAHADTSTILVMPLIGDRQLQCLKFDKQNQKYITYSHHAPSHHSNFMPAAIAKQFMSISSDGRYLAISWQPLNVDAELDPSKKSVLVYKTEKYNHTRNALLRSYEGDKPDCMIRFQGGCSFMPDGRLALINETHLHVFELKEPNDELEVEEAYKVDLQQDLDDDGVSRSDFYDDLPDIKEEVATKDVKKAKKSVSFKDLLPDTESVTSKEEHDTNEIPANDQISSSCSNDIFYEANSSQDCQQSEQQSCSFIDTLDEEEIEIISENGINSDEDFVFMRDISSPEMKETISSVTTDATVDNEVKESQVVEPLNEEDSYKEDKPTLPPPPAIPHSIRYDEESNNQRIESIRKHIKTLKQSGALFITSDHRHNVWKVEKNLIKLFFSLPRNKNPPYRATDNEYVLAISRFNNMVIASNQYTTFNTATKPNNTTELRGCLDVYDTCSESVIARLHLPANRKSVNAILQVSFIQKDMYAIALTYHYEASNHPSENCYFLDLWDIGSGTHLAGKSITSEVGYLPDAQFFINESIKLRYGCGAFIRAFPTVPPSVNHGCIKKSESLNNNTISALSAHLVPLLEDGRKKEEIYNGNTRKDFYISRANLTPAEKSFASKEKLELSDVFYVWSKAKQPSSSYSKRIPAFSLPVYFLDNDMTYILVVLKNSFHSVISVWKLVSFTTNTSSGPLMTVYDKQVLYSFGNTNANSIDRCLGTPAVLFDPSRILSSTSHSLNGRVSHSSSYIVPGKNNADNTPVLVVCISQKDTHHYRTRSKDTFNSDPNHIEFDYSTETSSSSTPVLCENKRKCCIAIPLLRTSMLECALHAIINEQEQEENISKVYFNQVFCREMYGGNPLSKSLVLKTFASVIPELFTTVAGTQLLTRLARNDKHNEYLEYIFFYLFQADMGNCCHLHPVVSLKKGYTRTHALREAFVSQSWGNVKSISEFLTDNGLHRYMLEKYQSYINQVVEE